MAKYLLDTNHIGKLVTPGSVIHQRVSEARSQGHRLGTCLPVLCELEVGIQQVSKPDRYRRNLDRILRFVRLWPMDQDTAKTYGIVHQELRKQGRVASSVDIMIASLARQHGLVLLSTDKDFDPLTDISREDWSL